jgi:phage baseplate assembly protein W
MASIVIDGLKATDNKNKPIYTDIKLDLLPGSVKSAALFSKNSVNDLVASYDIDAIKNSIYNLFTTVPGQKILNPIYGLNLLQFVFNGITESNSRLMGELILKGIKAFEPRLEVKKIYIFPDMDNMSYEIAIRLDVPSLNITNVTLKGVMSESGFYIN